jgi:hypothetical protein
MNVAFTLSFTPGARRPAPVRLSPFTMNPTFSKTSISTIFIFALTATGVPDPQYESQTLRSRDQERSNSVEMITIVTSITGVLVAILTLTFMGYKHWKKLKRDLLVCFLYPISPPTFPPFFPIFKSDNGPAFTYYFHQPCHTDKGRQRFLLHLFHPHVYCIYTEPRFSPYVLCSKACIRD